MMYAGVGCGVVILGVAVYCCACKNKKNVFNSNHGEGGKVEPSMKNIKSSLL